jgi:hypothetical protein
MSHLHEFIAQTGKQPAEWTNKDIQLYLDYIKKKENKTMKPNNYIVAAMVMSLLLMGASGCKQGPAERAGKKIDDTIQKGGEQIEKTGKKIQDDMKGK